MKLNKDSCYTVASATLIVAASDSLHKERADYVCDGVDDQVQIQAAIDALPDIGGTIYLTEGAFYINDTIDVQKPVVWRGAGVNWPWSQYPDEHAGTMLLATNTLNAKMMDIYGANYFGGLYEIGFSGQLQSQSVQIDDTGIDIHNNGDFTVFHCGFFRLPYRYPLQVRNHGSWIMNCDFEDCAKCDGALSLSNIRNWVTNCHFARNTQSLFSIFSHQYIHNCNFDHSQKNHMYLRGLDDCIISNCRFLTWNKASGNYAAIELQASNLEYYIIHDNIFDGDGCGAPAIWDNDKAVDYISIHNNLIYNMGGTRAIDMDTGNTNGLIKDNIGYITKKSGTSTGTGAQQPIAHSLAATPTKVILWNIEDGANPYQSAVADGTNIYVLAVINQDWGWEAEVV